ncbi:hypothetical protein [Cellulomonas telluris]|uniref:hypothetical protein n=1 Tax=Cellulomonas telluris TaxID=2306636 RepID=UPI0010A87A52|nr:hypothetical protein [Cellulomonas telluris]
MSASDAYVEWWEEGADPEMVVGRLLAAGLRTSSTTRPGLVDVLDDEGNRTPTSVEAFQELLRSSRRPVAFQLWFSDSEDLVVERVPIVTHGGGLHRTTANLDALSPFQFDVVVNVMASMVTDSPESTRAFILDASNDTAAYDWLPLARGRQVDVPQVDVVVARAGTEAAMLGGSWVQDVPAAGLRSRGWPLEQEPHPPNWYRRTRRAAGTSPYGGPE